MTVYFLNWHDGEKWQSKPFAAYEDAARWRDEQGIKDSHIVEFAPCNPRAYRP